MSTKRKFEIHTAGTSVFESNDPAAIAVAALKAARKAKREGSTATFLIVTNARAHVGWEIKVNVRNTVGSLVRRMDAVTSEVV